MPDRKKLYTYACAMLAALFLVTGCAPQTGTSTDTEPGALADGSPAGPVDGEVVSSTSSGVEPAAAGPSLAAEDYTALPGLFSDKVEQVLPAGDAVFVRSGGALWHLDAQGAPQQILPLTGDTVAVRAVPLSGGYGILEERMSADSDGIEEQVVVHFLDAALTPQKQIDLNALLDEEYPTLLIDCVAIAPDGSRIAFVSMETGLYLTETGSGSAAELYAFSAEVSGTSGGTHRLSGIDSLSFSPDGQSLLYTGSSWSVQDAKSVITYGKIPLSGGAPDNRTVGAIQEQLLSSQGGNGVYLPDGFLIKEDTRYKDGRLLFVDAGTLADSALALSSKQEGDIVCASENGRFLATIDDSAASGSFTVRVYSQEGGGAALLGERVIEVSEYTYAPNLLLLEDSRLCVALIGNRQEDLKTRIEAWTF